MLQKRELALVTLVVFLAAVLTACSAAPSAPATQAPATLAPAAQAPATEASAAQSPATEGAVAATSAPIVAEPTSGPAAAVQESPLQPQTGDSPLQPETSVSPLQPAGIASYVPVAAGVCEGLRKSVADTLKAKAESETAGFRDYVGNANGQGCLITVRGTGKDFPGGFVSVAQQLEQLFAGQGWTVDQAFAADSPTGTLFGLRKGNQLALIDAGWIATSDVVCPKDQPISACNIKPEQQNYTILVNVAETK